MNDTLSVTSCCCSFCHNVVIRCEAAVTNHMLNMCPQSDNMRFRVRVRVWRWSDLGSEHVQPLWVTKSEGFLCVRASVCVFEKQLSAGVTFRNACGHSFSFLKTTTALNLSWWSDRKCRGPCADRDVCLLLQCCCESPTHHTTAASCMMSRDFIRVKDPCLEAFWQVLTS